MTRCGPSPPSPPNGRSLPASDVMPFRLPSSRVPSFWLIVRLPGEHGGPGYSECGLASDALALCRRLARTRLRVEQILDLRAGHERSISGPELEAIAQHDRCDRHQASVSNGGAS